MQLRDFLNRVAQLRFVEFMELRDAGVPEQVCLRMLRDPLGTLAEVDDATAAKIWSTVEESADA